LLHIGLVFRAKIAINFIPIKNSNFQVLGYGFSCKHRLEHYLGGKYEAFLLAWTDGFFNVPIFFIEF
jgi:hypothetical protein